MEIQPIAFFRSPFATKFGIPRQSGLVEELRGRIVFVPEYRQAEALRGLEAFDYVWLIWQFSANRRDGDGAPKLTARPPRLGGNTRMGVFATRSPFRPNGLGLSAVRLTGIEHDAKEGPVVCVSGADLMDGTPIFDIKPYIPYADSHPDARGGFTDEARWQRLSVEMPQQLAARVAPDELPALVHTLELDPRPHYHNDPQRIYGMPFGGCDVRFRVEGSRLFVTDIAAAKQP